MKRIKGYQHLPLACAAVWLVIGASPACAGTQEIRIDEWLDRAASACERGDAQQLATVSAEIRRQVKQHPVLQSRKAFIGQLLGLFRAGVCDPKDQPQKRLAPPRRQLIIEKKSKRYRISAGFLDNINQGSRHERLRLNDPQTGIEVEGRLDEDSLPLSSPFISLQGSYRDLRVTGKNRRLNYAAVFEQYYTDEPDYSTTGLVLGRQMQNLDSGDASGAYMDIISDAEGSMRARLGGHIYRPWVFERERKQGWTAGAEYNAYPERSAYNAAIVNVGLERRDTLKSGAELALRARLTYDHALNERPGGDRSELELSGLWVGKEQKGKWQPDAGLKLAYERDAEPYDEVLFNGSVRNQTHTSLDLGMNRRFGKDKKIRVGYQYSQTRDSEVPLFDQPAGNAFTISFEGEW